MKFRVGILGCANIARRSLAPAFLAHPDFDLVAIASRSSEKAMDFISSLPPDVQTQSLRPMSYEGLIGFDDVDLIYCPLPNGLHYEWVKGALNAGKHVLCEKSLACTFKETSELVEIARSQKRLLMESFQFRFHRQNLFVKDLLASGKLGQIRQVVARFGFPPFPDGAKNIRYSRELGGGALLDAGAYTIKASTFLLGDRLKVLAATGYDEMSESVDLDGTMTFQSESGAVAQTAYSFHSQYQCGYEIWCERGMIATTRAFTAPIGFPAEVTVSMDRETTVYKFPDDHFQGLLSHVVNLLHTGNFEGEYEENITQAMLMQKVRDLQRK